MRFAIVGDLGMFGSELLGFATSRGLDAKGLNRSNFDLSGSQTKLATALRGFDVVVNAVAYTAVDRAEQEVELANRVNGEYAGKLAVASKTVGAKYIHISTDYVFPGTDANPLPTNRALEPINAYGRSKALGEALISDSGANFVIVRTAWLYGAVGHCFPRTIARKLQEGGAVSVVSDRVGQPTWTRDLASVVLDHSLNDYGEEIVHGVSSGSASWFEFALAIRDSMALEAPPELRPVARANYKTLAKRPASSALENSATKGSIIGNWLDRWKVAAPEVLASI